MAGRPTRRIAPAKQDGGPEGPPFRVRQPDRDSEIGLPLRSTKAVGPHPASAPETYARIVPNMVNEAFCAFERNN
jgi:hypothetical protein